MTGEAARLSQQQWLRERRFLNARRHGLGLAAQSLYPETARVAGTPLLADPRWLPPAPVPLEHVTLCWHAGQQACGVDGTGAESAAVRPLRDDGRRFGCYAGALGALDRPGLFADRACYRLLDTAVADGSAELTFGHGRYFDVINTCEAIAHEYAATTLAHGTSAADPAMPELPLRSLAGEPTSLRQRPVMVAICTLVVRAERGTGDAVMLLHWRDPAQVASGGGLYQVAPVGMFQPSHDAEWNLANDFSLWRCMVRELSEELLGGGEDYRSDTAPIDYGRWPLHAALSVARRSGQLRLYWLGLGADPLTLAADMLTVAVFDAGLFDATFARLVPANDEGHMLTSGDPARADVGVAFREENIERFAVREPMQPAGAALLRLAWQHRGTLLAG